MTSETLSVPFAGLNAHSHSINTRFIWMLVGVVPPAPTDARLRKQSGLDPKTVAQARTILDQAPLPVCLPGRHQDCAVMPVALLTDPTLSAGARLLYGQLQGVPDFKAGSGSFTYPALSQLTGTCAEALRRFAAELVTSGWLMITQKNRKSPISFTLRDPVGPRMRARIRGLKRRVFSAKHRGETLLREYLNITVAAKCEDDATPAFLVNPYTDELMEFDCYYPDQHIAFEFNGDQHYRETVLASFEETAKQVGRDAIKAFIARARGIELVIIHPEDLSLKAIQAKLPERLPRRDLTGLAPLVNTWEEMAREYREGTARERERTSIDGKRHTR